MTKIKICGLTDPKEAEYINRNGVEFVGNVLFFEKSKRNITVERAVSIHRELEKGILKVAVVVSPTPDQVLAIEDAGFDLIQIHGTLPGEDFLQRNGIGVIRAFNGEDRSELAICRESDRIRGVLWDAPLPGSGKLSDWSGFETFRRNLGEEKTVFLAGGLNPGNVGEAVRILQPDVVDVSSGVEYPDRPGKDPARVDAFVAAVKNAVALL
ncbi:MAG: phosphoribosylanthranilate isomerase [Lachnospiraceae bacterium]|nr:phosphoribosylanthranilate isomerase [Lachnospiraceae bacterium]